MSSKTVEISSQGRWFRVPAVEFEGKTIAVKGKWLRMAVIHEEDFTPTALQDPERCVEMLRDQRSSGPRGTATRWSGRA
jgi:hypothetical protein